MASELVLSVSDFVAVLNQTFSLAYPQLSVVGELSNFRVSKNRWVYFDLKDEESSLRCFGSVYQLPGPLEEGMMVQVTGSPKLHNMYGFSFTFRAIQPVGQGSIKRAAELLRAKLAAEGLFDTERKRQLRYPPNRIALVTSVGSAAYADFIKILDQRWGGLDIQVFDVQVQGNIAPEQIIRAITTAHNQIELADVLVIVRGGGSPDDLAAFNTEAVVRAVATSRIPTLVAIGHEVDISLAELAADVRASTPSNAAELLVPDKKHEGERLFTAWRLLDQQLQKTFENLLIETTNNSERLQQAFHHLLHGENQSLASRESLLDALSPFKVLQRGYSVLRYKGRALSSAKRLVKGQEIEALLRDGQAVAEVKKVILE